MHPYVPPQPGNSTKVTQAMNGQWHPPSKTPAPLAAVPSLSFIPEAASARPANPAARREQLYSGRSPKKGVHTVINADKAYSAPTENRRGRVDRRDEPPHRRMLGGGRSVSPTKRPTKVEVKPAVMDNWVQLPQTSNHTAPSEIKFNMATGATDGLGGFNTKPATGVPLPSCRLPISLCDGMEIPLYDVDEEFIVLRFQWPGYRPSTNGTWRFDRTQTNNLSIKRATLNQLATTACKIVLAEYERLKPLYRDIPSTLGRMRIMAPPSWRDPEGGGRVTIPEENVRVTGLRPCLDTDGGSGRSCQGPRRRCITALRKEALSTVDYM